MKKLLDVLLPACALPGFVRPGATEQDFWQDFNYCDRASQPA